MTGSGPCSAEQLRITALAVAVLALLGAAPAAAQPISATVGTTPTGAALPSGFLGLSMEYQAVHQYTGRNSRSVNPVLLQLIRNLDPGQSPVLRIGGDSADWTWWPIRGVIPRPGISYALTKGWMRTTQALAKDLGARLILGVNLAADRPAIATAEARAFLQGIGRRYISALEIGNEPDLYGVYPWYRDRLGHYALARSRRYNLSSYIKDASRWRTALPKLPLFGPSFSTLTWLSGLNRYLKAERTVKTVSVHRYPLRNATTDPTSPTYPTIANLLDDASAAGIAQQLAPYVAQAHGRHLAFRVGEMNSVSGKGHAGVSDTFASSLWILDTLFNLASVGVDGVNVHTLPGAAYQPFSFTDTGGWEANVAPEYYGMLLFARAFPPGAHVLPVSVAGGPVKVWATTNGATRVVLINKDPNNAATVQLSVPGWTGPRTMERLIAPSVSSTSGVTLDGQTFGPETNTGTLAGTPTPQTVYPLAGSYAVTLPAGSAALIQ